MEYHSQQYKWPEQEIKEISKRKPDCFEGITIITNLGNSVEKCRYYLLGGPCRKPTEFMCKAFLQAEKDGVITSY